MQVLSMIRRSFVNVYISKELFIFLYTTYVRPHLEYCAPIRESPEVGYKVSQRL